MKRVYPLVSLRYPASLRHPASLRSPQYRKPRGFKDLLSGSLLLLILFKASGSYALETPNYEVLYAEGNIEYRRYEPYTVVETPMSVDGKGEPDDRAGFKRLFDYISGANAPGADIAMTAPVMQSETRAKASSRATKIAMTAPVFESANDQGATMAFMLPSQYTQGTAPVPTDPQLDIRQVPARVVASIRYSGRWTQKNVDKFTRRLEAHLDEANIERTSEYSTAVYNPPFMPPFMRRNEILVEINPASLPAPRLTSQR